MYERGIAPSRTILNAYQVFSPFACLDCKWTKGLSSIECLKSLNSEGRRCSSMRSRLEGWDPKGHIHCVETDRNRWLKYSTREAAHGQISTNQKLCQSEPLSLWAPSGSEPIQMDQIPQSYRRQQDKQGVKMEQRAAEGRWHGGHLREIPKKRVDKEALVKTFRSGFLTVHPPKNLIQKKL